MNECKRLRHKQGPINTVYCLGYWNNTGGLDSSLRDDEPNACVLGAWAGGTGTGIREGGKDCEILKSH